MENKQSDLRPNPKVSPTDNNAVRAGTKEQPDNVRLPDTDMHVVTPEIGKGMADGQVTKG